MTHNTTDGDPARQGLRTRTGSCSMASQTGLKIGSMSPVRATRDKILNSGQEHAVLKC